MPGIEIGPDEDCYAGQASVVRKQGWAGFRKLATCYIGFPALQAFPSPLRWLYLVLVALTPEHWLQIASWAALGPLAVWALTLPWWAGLWVAASPLAFIGGRRLLQDVPVAALTLACIGFALHGNAIGLGVALFALLSVKEAAVFVVPALLVAWPGGWMALAVAGVNWLATLFAIFGRQTLPMFRAARSGHNTDYAKQNQKGSPHRLLVDLMLVSPISVCAALIVHNPLIVALSAVLLCAHAFAPVRNIRLVIAADLLLRCTLIPLWLLPVALLWDIYICWRVRFVYDPVTQGLTKFLT